MAAQDAQDRSPALRLDLSSSNNPFLRNSASFSASNPTSPPLGFHFHSPASQGSSNHPASPFDDPFPARPISRNPFLDPNLSINRPRSSAGTMTAQTNGSSKGSLTIDDIFSSLDIQDKPGPLTAPSNTLVDISTPGQETEPETNRNVPPTRRAMGPNPRRPTHQAGDSEGKPRRPVPRPGGPSAHRPPRPRRNSDSSAFDFDAKPLTEEEKKLIQAKRLEDMKKSLPPRKHRYFDIIDQLDCSGLYEVHHDGPFDAVTSYRNRKGSKRAPMQAFPKDSLNNSLGGSGPARPDHATFLGIADDEAFMDYSAGSAAPPKPADKGEIMLLDPTTRGDIVHGDESVGLGTSTFLEGTPAARAEIEKREQQRVEEMVQEGVQRKKSLAHRIRHINKGGSYGPGRMERAYSYRSPDLPASTGAIAEENNPFDSEYERGGSEQLDISKPTSPPLSNNPFDVPRGLERRPVPDPYDDGQPKPTGIIGRMKSLRGGVKRRPSDAQQQVPGPAA